MRLMLVDDEELSRRALRVTLGREMPDVQIVGEASDGVEAIDQAEKLQPDLIIMDIKMPEMDGLQAADALRRRGDPARIVFLSAYDEFEYARRAINLHADSYLLKPVETSELVKVLTECEMRIRGSLRPSMHAVTAAPGTAAEHTMQPESSPISWRLQRALEHIDANLSSDLFLDEVASVIGVGPQHLCRLFRTELHDSFSRLVNQRRIDHSCELLASTALNISEVSDRVGFRDANYFGKVFRKLTGMTPSEFRSSGSR